MKVLLLVVGVLILWSLSRRAPRASEPVWLDLWREPTPVDILRERGVL